MFSSRNIHFAILGLILGASAGYVYAFYRVPGGPPPITADAAAQGAPNGHPDVPDEQMLAMMKQAVEADPNQPEIVNRYAMVLFEAGKMEESEKWFAKAMELDRSNLDLRAMHGAVLYRLGRKDEAEGELEATLKQDPVHIPSLHGLFLISVEKQDVRRGESFLQQIEKLEPTYEGLPELRARLDAARGGAK